MGCSATENRLTRRRFLQTAFGAIAAGSAATGWTALHEAQDCRVLPVDAPVPHLPPAFEGLRVLFLSDTHHSRHVPLAYLERVVALANAQEPDLVLLGGDYVVREWDDVHFPSRAYVRPGVGVLGKLRAPLGVFAVLGNHDGWQGHVEDIRAALAENNIPELRNHGVWLERSGRAGEDGRPQRLRLAGTEDFWTGRPDTHAALGDAREGDAVLLLQHNPDLIEEMAPDPRIGLALSGHTHGGQVVIPGLGYAPIVSSYYGQKFLHGFCRGGRSGVQVFVTRGVGTIGPPVRLGCPPEVVLLSLHRAA